MPCAWYTSRSPNQSPQETVTRDPPEKQRALGGLAVGGGVESRGMRRAWKRRGSGPLRGNASSSWRSGALRGQLLDSADVPGHPRPAGPDCAPAAPRGPPWAPGGVGESCSWRRRRLEGPLWASGPPSRPRLPPLQAPVQPAPRLFPTWDRSKERPDQPEMGAPTFILFHLPSGARPLKMGRPQIGSMSP